MTSTPEAKTNVLYVSVPRFTNPIQDSVIAFLYWNKFWSIIITIAAALCWEKRGVFSVFNKATIPNSIPPYLLPNILLLFQPPISSKKSKLPLCLKGPTASPSPNSTPPTNQPTCAPSPPQVQPQQPHLWPPNSSSPQPSTITSYSCSAKKVTCMAQCPRSINQQLHIAIIFLTLRSLLVYALDTQDRSNLTPPTPITISISIFIPLFHHFFVGDKKSGKHTTTAIGGAVLFPCWNIPFHCRNINGVGLSRSLGIKYMDVVSVEPASMREVLRPRVWAIRIGRGFVWDMVAVLLRIDWCWWVECWDCNWMVLRREKCMWWKGIWREKSDGVALFWGLNLRPPRLHVMTIWRPMEFSVPLRPLRAVY